MKITKSFPSSSFATGIRLVVDYDPRTGEVEVLQIAAYNWSQGTETDITQVFEEHFAVSLNQMVHSTDWASLMEKEDVFGALSNALKPQL